MPNSFNPNSVLSAHTWTRREIESYFCYPTVLERWAESESEGPLFRGLMVDAIAEIESALQRVNLGSPWDNDMKVSEQFFQPVFESFYELLGRFNTMSKSDYHILVNHIEPDEIDPEVISVLDAIAGIADDAAGAR